MEPDFEISQKSAKESNAASKWEQFSPYWPLLFFFLAICLAGAWFYLQYTPPLYEAKSAVLIKDEKKGVDESKMVEGFNQLSGTKIIENEIEVITSRTLLNDIVNRFQLYAPVYDQKKWRAYAAYSTSPVKVEVMNPQAIRETERIDFTFDNLAQKVIIGADEYPINETVETKYGKIRFLVNNNIDPDADTSGPHQYYFSLIKPKRVTSALAGRIVAISANKLSSVIDLSLKDEVPQRAEDILNALVTGYNNAALKDKNLLADSTLTFLDERIKSVSGELEAIERKMQNYRSSKDVIDISSQGKLFLENVNDNDQKIAEVNMQLAVLDEIEKSVQSKDVNTDIVPSSLVVSDPVLIQRLESLSKAEQEYDKLKKNTAENNPIIVSVKSQIDKLKPGIIESVKNQKNSLNASKNSLVSSGGKYNSLLQSVPKKEKELIEISRAQTLKSNLYNYLSQKREEIALSHSSLLPDSRIVDKAEASLDPVSPNEKIVYFAACILAFLFFIGVIIFREFISTNILYRQEIERFTSVPVITEIPYQKKKAPLVISKYETTFIAEQFRKLRASLAYLGINQRRKKILVTSVIPGEGKSFISANLGLSLALTGKKVLLLEFDLVNPGLSQKFNIQSEKGITSFLNGEAEPEEIIKRTDACEDLFIIPAGELAPNPSELIVSKKSEELLQYAEAIFDYIIVDTAPVGLRSDAYVLSRLCNATLYVIRHKKTPKKSVKRIDENNKINELKNMAIVFNGVKPKGFSKNNYGYGYEYKYADKKKKQSFSA